MKEIPKSKVKSDETTSKTPEIESKKAKNQTSFKDIWNNAKDKVSSIDLNKAGDNSVVKLLEGISKIKEVKKPRVTFIKKPMESNIMTK